MSLVAALLVGSSAFAIDNVKVSGDAKVYYSTSDAERIVNGNNDASLFNTADSAAQAAASLSLSADLAEGISAGTKVTALSTLGLQGQLVSNVWEQGTNDTYTVNELWAAATVAKTTVKVGRMPLDTPLVFTETWSIMENTFEAAVLINQDIPNTTLIGAYVGGSNGQLVRDTNQTTATPNTGAGIGSVTHTQGVNTGTTFAQFYKGAYAAAAINNSWKPLTVQAWYFDATQIAQAYWLQADLNMNGVLVGAQYTMTDLTNSGLDTSSNTAYALMAGYTMKDVFTAKVSYSATGTDSIKHGAGFNLAGTGQSKLYTEAWWNYGKITQADTKTFHVSVEGTVAEIDLAAYYTNADQASRKVAGIEKANNDLSELTITATKSVGPLDATVAYINATVQNQNNTTTNNNSNTVQAYLTLNF